MSTFAKASFNAASYSSGRPTYPPKLFECIDRYYKHAPEGCAVRWDRAADIGCGTGQAASHLHTLFPEIVCVDPSEGMLRKARDVLCNHRSSPPSSPSFSSSLPSPSFSSAAELSSSSTAEGPKTTTNRAQTQFTFTQGSAEDLRGAFPSPQQDGTVDLLIAAQACHWFDWTKVWPEVRRVLRPKGGVAAFWVYGELRLTSFPSLTPLITDFWQGTDPDSTTSIGAYFQRPGRTVLERLLVDVPAPADVLGKGEGEGEDGEMDLQDFQRHYFTDDKSSIPALPQTQTQTQHIHPTLMRTHWRWIDVLLYLRTASALHAFHERFPHDLALPDDERFLEADLGEVGARFLGVATGLGDPLSCNGSGGFGGNGSGNGKSGNGKREREVGPEDVKGGDVAVRFWKDLREGARGVLEANASSGGSGASEAKGGVDKGVGLFDRVTVEWPVALLLVRRV